MTTTLFGYLNPNNSLEERVTALENSGALLPLSQQGDILSRNTISNVRVPIGVSDNQVLTVDSSTATHLNWKQPDHVNLLNKGTNTHAQIDTAIADHYAKVNQDVRTSAAPSFLGPLHLGGLTQDGAITLSTTASSTSTIRCGAVGQIPMEVVGASSNVYSLNDTGSSGSITTGPNSSVSGNVATFSNTAGAIQDSGISSSNVVTLAGTQTLTNKTIDSATNTIQISGTNVNSLINQDVRTTSLPSFTNVTISTTLGTGSAYTDSQVVGLNSTTKTLRQLTNVATTDTSQTLTNKTINTSANTIAITSGSLSSTDINSVLDQTLLTTSNPTHALLTLTTGLKLPTSGGTQGTLDYYENFTQAINYGGIWAANQAGNLYITRIGKTVIINGTTALATCTVATYITVDYTLPTRLRPSTSPASNLFIPIQVFQTNVPQVGQLFIETGGGIRVYATAAQTNFATGASTGVVGWTASYNIA